MSKLGTRLAYTLPWEYITLSIKKQDLQNIYFFARITESVNFLAPVKLSNTGGVGIIFA